MINDIISYKIIGFESIDKNATYSKEFDNISDTAIEFIKLVKSGKYMMITIRKESKDPVYGENLSTSAPIFRWPIDIEFDYCPELIKQYHELIEKEVCYV